MAKGADHPAWIAQKGRFSDPVAGAEARRKSHETRSAKKKLKEAMKSSEYLYEAAERVMSEDPQWLDNIIKMYKDIASSPDVPAHHRMQAADALTTLLGTRAPKKTEIAVEKKPEPMEDTVQRLKQLGVKGIPEVDEDSQGTT